MKVNKAKMMAISLLILMISMFLIIILLLIDLGLASNQEGEINEQYAINESNIKQAFSIETIDTTGNEYLTQNEMRDMMYPVGSIYIGTNDADPNKFIGGKWEKWGSGQVLTGVNEAETEFETAEKTGGEKTTTLTTEQLPSHTHTFNVTTSASGTHNHTYSATTSNPGNHTHQMRITKKTISVATGGSNYAIVDNTGLTALSNKASSAAGQHSHTYSFTTSSSGGHFHTISGTTGSTGSGQAHNNLQPYITCYMWKRVE